MAQGGIVPGGIGQGGIGQGGIVQSGIYPDTRAAGQQLQSGIQQQPVEMEQSERTSERGNPSTAGEVSRAKEVEVTQTVDNTNEEKVNQKNK